MSFVKVVCCQVQMPATGRSLVQRIPTECGVFAVCACVCVCVYACLCTCVCMCVCLVCVCVCV